MSRFIIEGTWTGYNTSQSKIVHVSVHEASRKKLREFVEKTYSILYTDGTRLLLRVRDAKPRERVKARPSYMSLIEECCHHGVSSVDALMDARKQAKAVSDA